MFHVGPTQQQAKNDHAIIMNGTISSICRTNVCISGIYRPQVYKIRMTMTRILHSPASLLAADPQYAWGAHSLLDCCANRMLVVVTGVGHCGLATFYVTVAGNIKSLTDIE